MIRTATVVVLAMAAAAVAAHGGEVVFESKPARTHLIELYTSEGCSSCPAAEAWMSALKNESRLWQEVVPVAFHVDYWDHLGWRDPFGSKTWTERQMDYSLRWKQEKVYTPAFALDGREWRSGPLPPPATETPGVLRISVNGDRVTASFKPAGPAKARYEVHVARLAFAATADVTAGENAGRKMVHDFVVLGLASETLKAGSRELRLPAAAAPASTTIEPRTAVAAWVTAAGQIEPVQAVGGWLP